MDPATLALISAGISAGGSALGGLLGRNKGDKRKQQLIDDLLLSLKGKGSYNDLFNADEAAFQKSFVNPAKNIFNNQIAPQIQQSYIANGQQRGSGIEDTLARAGVNLDDLINQNFLQFQQGAQNRASSAISSILGQNNPNGQTSGSAAMQGLGGYFAGKGFGQDISNIFGNDDISRLLKGLDKNKSSSDSSKPSPLPRTGYEAEYGIY